MARRKSRHRRPSRPGQPAGAVLAEDLAAAAALREAGGTCARCGRSPRALVAVEEAGGYRAECVARLRCDRHVRAELREGRS